MTGPTVLVAPGLGLVTIVTPDSYSRLYGLRKRSNDRAIDQMKITPLDRIDLNILMTLQQNNRIYNQELADRVFVSAPTCLRRVRRLRDSGIIQRDVSILNPAMTGPMCFFILHLSLHEESKQKMASLEKEFSSNENVLQCHLVTGEWDYTLTVCTHSISEFHSFIDTHIYANPLIKRFFTQTVLKEVKNTTTLPLKDISPP
jgi:Lrp/AsnC family transcriptional regulator, leucine-responsive regulatory protein